MATNQLFQKIIKSSVLILFGNIIGVGALFIARILSARQLNPESYGLLVLCITILNILTYISLIGLPRGLGRQIPQDSNPSDIIVLGLQIPVLLAAIMSVSLITVSDIFVKLLGEPNLSSIINIFLLSLPSMVLLRVLFGVFQGTGDSLAKVISQNFMYQGSVLFLVAAVSWYGFKLTGIAFAWATGLVVGSLMSLFLFFYRTNKLIAPADLIVNPFSNWITAKELVTFSFPLMISGFMLQLLVNFDNILIAFFLKSDDVGIYDASFTIGMSLRLFINAFGFLVLPVISELDLQENKEGIDTIFKITAKWLVFISLPIYLLLIISPLEVLNLAFRDSYSRNGGNVVIIISTAFFFRSVLGLNSNTLTAIGHPRLVMLSDVGAVMTNLTLNFVLIPWYGIVGAAISSLVSICLASTIRTYYIYVNVGTQPLYGKLVIPTVVSTAVSLSILLSIYTSIAIWSQIAIIITVHIVSIFAFGGIEEKDKKLFNKIVTGIL